jgi:hypothetical protein
MMTPDHEPRYLMLNRFRQARTELRNHAWADFVLSCVWRYAVVIWAISSAHCSQFRPSGHWGLKHECKGTGWVGAEDVGSVSDGFVQEPLL